MNTIQSIAVNNNTLASIEKVNVERITYNPSYVEHNQVTSEQCLIITQKASFSAWDILAEECIVHLVKGESLYCTYTTEDSELKAVQINGCNSTRVLNECYT